MKPSSYVVVLRVDPVRAVPHGAVASLFRDGLWVDGEVRVDKVDGEFVEPVECKVTLLGVFG